MISTNNRSIESILHILALEESSEINHCVPEYAHLQFDSLIAANKRSIGNCRCPNTHRIICPSWLLPEDVCP